MTVAATVLAGPRPGDHRCEIGQRDGTLHADPLRHHGDHRVSEAIVRPDSIAVRVSRWIEVR